MSGNQTDEIGGGVDGGRLDSGGVDGGGVEEVSAATCGRHPPPFPEWRPDELGEHGEIAELEPHGATYYEVHRIKGIDAEAPARVFLLFHGMSWFSFTYTYALIPAMKAAWAGSAPPCDWEIITFDFYGRGRSAAPAVTYDLELFMGQADALLAHLGVEGPVDLVGHSMGGAVAAGYTSTRGPARVRTLFLNSPAGTPVNMPFLGRLITVPVLGWALFRMVGRRSMLQRLEGERCQADLVNWDAPEMQGVVDALIARLRWCIEEKEGWMAAFHSTLRHFPMSDCMEHFEAVGGMPEIPVRVLWGEADQILPVANADLVGRAIPHAQVVRVPGVGHSPLIDEPLRVHELFVDWML